MKTTPKGIIDIPTIENQDQFDRNRDKADSEKKDHCPCCGRIINNPKYFINSIYGGCAYPASDKNTYNDAWVMGVGSECRKKFPEGYVFESSNTEQFAPDATQAAVQLLNNQSKEVLVEMLYQAANLRFEENKIDILKHFKSEVKIIKRLLKK